MWEQSWLGSACLGEAWPTSVFHALLTFGWDRIDPARFGFEQSGTLHFIHFLLGATDVRRPVSDSDIFYILCILGKTINTFAPECSNKLDKLEIHLLND